MNLAEKKDFQTSLDGIFPYPMQIQFSKITTLSNSKKYGLWSRVGMEIGLSQRVVADYYHNTWTRQFYSNPRVYENLVRELIFEVVEGIPKSDLISAVAEKLAGLTSAKFHTQQLRIYIGRQLNKQPKFTSLQLNQLAEVLCICY
ncbi:hypothetical protein SS50377_22973 [Spironucleus salmonicida]|uniref:Uncharacterized protein n=1 Tax=Spironucleus salmonicida TaxID=348837 RepID=V6LW94_9EUKA|nr:hypothetical protein SS50377_22973 [Spironucleus salmonicida]|eukprot:EST47981.1 Hypothetical protein SS50377_11895 [Spironucleus salmonicida]